MIVYRLATAQYADDISGTGAKLLGGRWNVPGFAVLYTAENISLAVLEIVVNADRHFIPPTYQLLKLSIPDAVEFSFITKDKLKQQWKDDFEYTQWIGTEFLKQNKHALMKVPSAVVDEEHNFLFNPRHSEFKKVKIVSTASFLFDNRLHLHTI
jgi:RES domain-containing protein